MDLEVITFGDARRTHFLNIAGDDANTHLKGQANLPYEGSSAILIDMMKCSAGASRRQLPSANHQTPFLLGSLLTWLGSLVHPSWETPSESQMPDSLIDKASRADTSPSLFDTIPLLPPRQATSTPRLRPKASLDLRQERGLKDFHRLSPSYRPGRYADQSGLGFEDTSGANSWAWSELVDAETKEFKYAPRTEGEAVLLAVRLSDELGQKVPSDTRRAAELEDVLQRRRREWEEEMHCGSDHIGDEVQPSDWRR